MESDIINIQQEEITTLDEFIKKLEENAKKDENGVEYWSARDLQNVLEYSKWSNFENVINRAKTSCQTFGKPVNSHFADIGKVVDNGGVAPQIIKDYKLTRYACYLIAQNADAKKKIVAFAQAYFSVQTRRQEIDDIKMQQMSENEKRIQLREDIKKHNSILSGVAKEAGVIEPLDYAIFNNEGYKGLYDGRTAKDIAKERNLPQNKILDYMGNEELGANIFRITQTAAKIKRENIKDKHTANQAHYAVGKKVRQTIEEIGGTMPEDLPIEKNINKVKSDQKKLAKKMLKPKKITE